MTWLHKRGGVWWIGWRASGKQFLKSAQKTDPKKAGEYRERIEEIEQLNRNGALEKSIDEKIKSARIDRNFRAFHL